MASLDPKPAPITSQNRLGSLMRFKWRPSHPQVSQPAQIPPPAEVVQPEIFVCSPKLEEALDIAVRAAVLNTGATGVAIALTEKGKLVCRARLGDIAPDLGVTLNVSSGITGACVRTAQVLTCSDTQTDERVDAEVCRILGVRSILVVPIFVSSAVVGILEALSANPETFTPNHSQRLQRIATFVSGVAHGDPEITGLVGADVAEPLPPSTSSTALIQPPPTPAAEAQGESSEDAGLSAFRDVLEKIGPKSSWEDISQELVSRIQGGRKD